MTGLNDKIGQVLSGVTEVKVQKLPLVSEEMVQCYLLTFSNKAGTFRSQVISTLTYQADEHILWLNAGDPSKVQSPEDNGGDIDIVSPPLNVHGLPGLTRSAALDLHTGVVDELVKQIRNGVFLEYFKKGT